MDDLWFGRIMFVAAIVIGVLGVVLYKLPLLTLAGGLLFGIAIGARWARAYDSLSERDDG